MLNTNATTKSDPETPRFVELQDRDRCVQVNLTTLRTYFDLLFSKSVDKLLDLIDPNIEWLIVPTGELVKGRDAFVALAKNHWAASPNRTKNLVSLFANEEYASMEYVSGGTLTGDANVGSTKIAATGAEHELQCCFVFHLTSGKIDRVREYFDMETVKRITGQAKEPVAPAALERGN
jgi:ketosteroid isomerase-like protein